MSLLDRINLNYLRVFEATFRTRSMTTAARELHLTQSGISQQVKLLEDILKVRLFDRVGRTIVPTAAAQELYQSCESALGSLERTLLRVTGGDQEISGRLRVGAPPEFAHNLILPRLAAFGRRHPKVQMHMHIEMSRRMPQLLLGGEIDFAFIDAIEVDGRIETGNVYEESLELCVAEDLLSRLGPPAHRKEFYEALPYVEYLEGEPFLRSWFRHHLPRHQPEPAVRAYVNDAQGIAQLVTDGVGAGVLPGQLISRWRERGAALTVLAGCGSPLRNTIQVAWLKGKTHSRPAQAALDWIQESLVNDRK